MGDATAIEWADATWNPIVGCEIVSPGCKHCYAMGMAARIQRMNPATHYRGTTQETKAGPVWTGKIAIAPDHVLSQPLRWRRPRRIFVNSMGDLGAPGVTDAMRDRVWAVMACAPWHVFMVLTKRPDVIRAYVQALIADPSRLLDVEVGHPTGRQPLSKLVDFVAFSRALPNVWLGVTAEDQPRADERIPELLATPAAIRFVSYEPAIGPLDLEPLCGLRAVYRGDDTSGFIDYEPEIDWVICGGESGPNARPMHPQWARDVRDYCAAAGVAFHFKQWGEWVPVCQWPDTEEAYDAIYHPAPQGHPDACRRPKVPMAVLQRDGSIRDDYRSGAMLTLRVGKQRAGRKLGDRTHDDFPGASQ